MFLFVNVNVLRAGAVLQHTADWERATVPLSERGTASNELMDVQPHLWMVIMTEGINVWVTYITLDVKHYIQ